ncbi:MAG: helix-turn-helix domain-containing protein [Betaproteobacteria bacterium]|jgi:transcriptional regulator with XRE-family HTH domain|nr:helix-turn-helix domain-containing protein [Betaproteobacteria bacterium]
MKKVRSPHSSKDYSLSALIRRARGNLTQNEFGGVLGVSQNLLSKYESGAIPNPPASVIEKCLALVDAPSAATTPDATDIANRIRSSLSGPEHADVRAAISTLIDFVTQNSRIKRMRKAP